jgi:FKBP-type peptidyl-prolyl cis-trans isomerase
MRVFKTARLLTVALTSLTLLACGTDVSGPDDVEFQVIEELNFAPTLNIDLASMEQTTTGVYYEDVVDGEGTALVWGDLPTVAYQGWLANGQRFDDGTFSYRMGNNEVVPGFEQGMFGMKPGGVRMMIIPPVLAYGASGAGSIPPGSVLIFQVEVLSVQYGDPG